MVFCLMNFVEFIREEGMAFDSIFLIMSEVSVEEFPSDQHIFSLFSLNQHKDPLNVECSFPPIECPRTSTRLPTHPTYHPSLPLPFLPPAMAQYSQPSIPPPSAPKNPPQPMLVPKPSSHFCQLCKAPYEDYLKHIKHPFHLRKQQEKDETMDFSGLGKTLQKFQRRSKKKPSIRMPDRETSPQPDKDRYNNDSITSIDLPPSKPCGSKQRIVTLEDGNREAITISRCELEEDLETTEPVHRNRKAQGARWRECRGEEDSP